MVLIQRISDGKTTPEDFLEIYKKMDEQSKETIFLIFYNALELSDKDFKKLLNLETFDLSKDLKTQFKKRIHWDILMYGFEWKYKRIRHSFLQEKTYAEFVNFVEEILKAKFKDYLYYKKKQEELSIAGSALSIFNFIPFVKWITSIASISCYSGSIAMGSMGIKTKHKIKVMEKEMEEFTNYWLEFGMIESPTDEQLKIFDEKLRNFYITLSNTIEFKTLKDREIFDNLFINLYSTSETKTDKNKLIDKKTMSDLYAILLKYKKVFVHRYKFDKNDEISIFLTASDILLGVINFGSMIRTHNVSNLWDINFLNSENLNQSLNVAGQVGSLLYKNISNRDEHQLYDFMFDFYELLKDAFETFWKSSREFKDEVIFIKRIIRAINSTYLFKDCLINEKEILDTLLETLTRLLPWDYYSNLYCIY
ncbi:hypothetical protein [[Mycoplasma] anseris]|nr:hypothetical protein [[Mycoplasma] anseris]